MVGYFTFAFMAAVLLLLGCACWGIKGLPDPAGPGQIFNWMLEREIVRAIFHWKHTSVISPFCIAMGFAMIGIGYTLEDYHSPIFVFAYLLLIFGFGWLLVWWLVSDILYKRNPANWSRSRQRRASSREWVTYKIWKYGVSVFIVVTAAAFVSFTDWVETQKQLLSFHAWLVPANDPSPPNPCSDIPKNALAVYLGSNLMTFFNNQSHVYVLVAKGKPLIALDKNPDGKVALTMEIYDETEHIVVEIKKNEFRVAHPPAIFKKESKDKSSLVVVIPYHNKEVLNLRYLNPTAIQIRGSFRYPGVPPIEIDEQGTLRSMGLTFRRTCVQNIAGGLFGYD